jgi:hypothetical protein|tara:strand:- start:181 stop:930 length:750 start_codon:yes stop_codon:yes gene_type:complete
MSHQRNPAIVEQQPGQEFANINDAEFIICSASALPDNINHRSILSSSFDYFKNCHYIFQHDIKYNNTDGLASVYNNFLEKYKDRKYIIFCHDDIFIESVNFYDILKERFEKGYDVLGLAGGSRLKKEKPLLWHLATKKETHSGIVYHPHEINGEVSNLPTIFGHTPKEVAILDGLFLAVKVKSLIDNNVRFDENLTGFHFYDIKFSIDCKKAGLKLSTVNLKVVHKSHGLSDVNNLDWHNSQNYVLDNI